MKKRIFSAGLLFVGLIAMAATYTNSWTDGIFTGNGSTPADITTSMCQANFNGTVQISRNDSRDGGGRGSALDLYSGIAESNAYLQRWWIPCAVDGGKCPVISIDYGGQMRMLTSLLISGIVKDHNSNEIALTPLPPTNDSFMTASWNDLGSGANIYAAAGPYASEGDSNSQVFIAMDGHVQDAGVGEYHPNVRFTIDGNSGALRWTNSIANTYSAATWDAKFGRVSANILGDPSGTTNLQTLHLDQPSTKHDIAGQIAIVAAALGSFTFATPYTSAPSCVASPSANPGATTWWVTTTATQVKVNLSAASTINFWYHCVGNAN